MRISKTKLLKALSVIKPGLANTDSIDQTTSFAFMEDSIVTYNDSISISIPFESGITGAVSSKELYAYLNKLSDKIDDIKLNVKGKELIISADKGERVGIRIIEKIKLPLDEIDKDQKWKKIPNNLIEGLLFCSFSTAKDQKKPLLTCVHVKDNIIESTDNKRATNFQLNKKISSEFLIPASSIKFLKDFNAIKYNATKSWVNFLSREGAIFSCRVISQEFPDIASLMETTGKKMKFPDEIKTAVEKAVVFCDKEEGQDHTFIELKLSKNLITVKGQGSVGWFTKKTKSKYVGDSFMFSISSEFFLDMLKRTDTCYIDKKTKRIKFSAEQWNHVFLIIIADEDMPF